MLRTFVEDDPWHWDTLLPALLFTVREVPQAFTGFSHFELLHGMQFRGILELIRENWEEQGHGIGPPHFTTAQTALNAGDCCPREPITGTTFTRATVQQEGQDTELRAWRPGLTIVTLC